MIKITHFSNLNKIENKNMNKIAVDLAIVYKVIVIYCNDQLLKPISAALAIPVGSIRVMYVYQSNVILFRDLFTVRFKTTLIRKAVKNLTIK